MDSILKNIEADCKSKDAIIANLNKYIELLEKDRGH